MMVGKNTAAGPAATSRVRRTISSAAPSAITNRSGTATTM